MILLALSSRLRAPPTARPLPSRNWLAERPWLDRLGIVVCHEVYSSFSHLCFEDFICQFGCPNAKNPKVGCWFCLCSVACLHANSCLFLPLQYFMQRLTYIKSLIWTFRRSYFPAHPLFFRCVMYSSPRNVVAAMLRQTQPSKDATTSRTNALPMEAFRTRLVPITKRLPMIVLRLPWPILVLHRVVVPSSLSIFDTTSFSTGSTRVHLLLIPSLERYVTDIFLSLSWYSTVVVMRRLTKFCRIVSCRLRLRKDLTLSKRFPKCRLTMKVRRNLSRCSLSALAK